jgi:hypothetical protein
MSKVTQRFLKNKINNKKKCKIEVAEMTRGDPGAGI